MAYICDMKLENLDKTKKQMRRGVLELCVLSTIASEEEIYSTTIVERLKLSQFEVPEGTLYPLLSRLKNGGLLTYTWKESSSGPPRKYFSITDEGRTVLDGLVRTWNEIVEAVNHATQNNHLSNE